jgi:hypothetical protein
MQQLGCTDREADAVATPRNISIAPNVSSAELIIQNLSTCCRIGFVRPLGGGRDILACDHGRSATRKLRHEAWSEILFLV